MAKYGLTQEKIEGQIASVDYSTFGKTGIHCTITLVNGYTVAGESICIDPTIFNEDIGKEVAYENAFDKLWFLLGYNEKQRWYEETQLTWLDRVHIELANLDEKRSKLEEMIQKGKPSFMSNEQFNLLKEQYDAMTTYALILAKRIEMSKVLKAEDIQQ